ncbi:protein-L-isoaspartate(D-aspartate) O-methyltransferase [Deferribacterales bacterium RsTz2092]|nr:protein-L-isoaspartate O-methyltransferase [Deferribacterales bacterium]
MKPISHAQLRNYLTHIIAPSCHNNIAVVSAFAAFPRELFVDEVLKSKAYTKDALPIGYGQTISQPALVAYMLEMLELSIEHSCLEIGSGSGFVTALLSKLVKQVYAVDIVPELVLLAKRRLRNLHVRNADVSLSDGSLGLAEKAPFDRILASAGANSLPSSLVAQLAVNGIMLIPLNGILTKIIKAADKLETIPLGDVSFVDFINT